MNREDYNRFDAAGAHGPEAMIPPTTNLGNAPQGGSVSPPPPQAATAAPGDTMPLGFQQGVTPGQSPVVGWLVVVSGEFKGRDYRLHPGFNFVGRCPYESHVCIDFDQTVTKVKHAKLLYDDRGNKFYISHDSGVNPTRLNEEIVDTRTELKAYDKILVGETELVFVPFCGETFKW